MERGPQGPDPHRGTNQIDPRSDAFANSITDRMNRLECSAQRKDKAYFDMTNFDWTQHAKGCGCEGCTTFGKVLVRMLESIATSEDQETRLVGFHLTAWLNGSLKTENSK